MANTNFAPELIIYNGRITTNDPRQPEVSALAISDGLVSAAGDDRSILAMSGERTRQIDLQRRRVIPGLNDSHLHVIRAGLFYNLELRWDGMPLGAGTDGTRVASYHPWTCLWWLVSGKSVGGSLLNADKKSRLSREEALMLYTSGSAWFSKEDHCKGRLAKGYFADLAVLNADYFGIEEDEIRGIESVLTIVGGKPVHATGEFKALAPPLPPVSPAWSPVAHYGGYDNSQSAPPRHTHGDCGHLHANGQHQHLVIMGAEGRFWSAGCPCAA
jgi:predicted amidohydrolase YtcJ